MRRRRVLISANTIWNLTNFRGGLIRALIASGYDVVVAAPHDAFASRLLQLGCSHVNLPMNNKGTSPASDLILLWRYWRLLLRERPDAVLGYTIKPNIYGSLAAHAVGVPVINNISGLGTAFIRGGWLAAVVRRLYAISLRRSRLVYFQNKDDQSLFVELGLVRPDQTELLPGSGIDLTRFQPVATADRADKRPLCFLLVARLLWDKGVGEFVEAARLVRLRYPEIRFQLLGFLDVENRTAIDRSTVERWVEEGIVEYPGAADDVRPYLAAADCVVLPSYREGTSRTLLEAAAMARPLIATDVPGCREVVDDGVNGLLCKVRDAVDLAEKMLRMIEMPASRRNAMGDAGRLKVEREYDERLVIERYLGALTELFDGATVGR